MQPNDRLAVRSFLVLLFTDSLLLTSFLTAVSLSTMTFYHIHINTMVSDNYRRSQRTVLIALCAQVCKCGKVTVRSFSDNSSTSLCIRPLCEHIERTFPWCRQSHFSRDCSFVRFCISPLGRSCHHPSYERLSNWREEYYFWKRKDKNRGKLCDVHNEFHKRFNSNGVIYLVRFVIHNCEITCDTSTR